MSHVTEEIKLNAAVSMDPFDEEILPFDVHENILQYLNGSDLLKASEVSRRWNRKVENAKGFIEKIKLTFTSIPAPEGIVTPPMLRNIKNDLSKDDIAAVLNSKRHYVNVEIRFYLLNSFALRQELLKKFEDSIKNLALDHYFDKPIPDVTFPKLTQLEMLDPNCQNYWRSYEILLLLMPALETLRVETLSDWNGQVIRSKSKSLKDVRFKRLSHGWSPIPDPSLKPVNNNNISFIKE